MHLGSACLLTPSLHRGRVRNKAGDLQDCSQGLFVFNVGPKLHFPECLLSRLGQHGDNLSTVSNVTRIFFFFLFSPKEKDDNPGQFAAPLDQGKLLLTFGVLIIPQ